MTATDASAEAPPAAAPPIKVSLREQADEAQRELAMRHRVYPGLVKRGKMTEAEAAGYIGRMRVIRDTLRLFAEHEDAVRQALAAAIRAQRLAEQLEELREDPAVAAVLEEFPDATLSIREPAA